MLSSHINNVPDDQTYANDNLLKTLVFKQLRDPSIGANQTSGNVGGLSGTPKREITLHHCWPSEVSQIGLDMGEGGNLVSFSVTFSYDYYAITTNSKD